MGSKINYEDEWLENHRQQLLHENEMMFSTHKPTIEAFKEYCRSAGIALKEEHFKFVPTIGVIAEYPNIVMRLVSDLSIDKENLVNFGHLPSQLKKHPGDAGYLYADNFMVMANPVFRRGLCENNNWAPRFVDLFWGINGLGIDAYLALDYNRVRINVDGSRYFEADTWYGAPFSEDIPNIADGVANLRPPSDIEQSHLEFLFANAYALDVCWNTNNKIKTFQALEFKGVNVTVKIDGEEFHPARYIHAEYDLTKKYFRHFDGAVQYFKKDEYLIRRDSNFRHNVKDMQQIKALSGKVFKFNGKISVDLWTEFCSHFFTANPLIHEYFSGSYPAHLNDTLIKIRAKQKYNT